jgi:hypothetical protein
MANRETLVSKEHLRNALAHVNAAYEEMTSLNKNAFKMINRSVLDRLQCDMDRLLGGLEVVNELTDENNEEENADHG